MLKMGDKLAEQIDFVWDGVEKITFETEGVS